MKHLSSFFLITAFLLCLSKTAISQTNCNIAIQSLQLYAAQVNQIYNNEYYTIIPKQRCPATDQFGNFFNPQLVQNCRIQTLGYLNNWYAQQCNYVNNWYAQIVQGCAIPNNSSTPPAPDPQPGAQASAKISTSKIKDLSAGVDDDKTVRITIPTTAEGFRP